MRHLTGLPWLLATTTLFALTAVATALVFYVSMLAVWFVGATISGLLGGVR